MLSVVSVAGSMKKLFNEEESIEILKIIDLFKDI